MHAIARSPGRAQVTCQVMPVKGSKSHAGPNDILAKPVLIDSITVCLSLSLLIFISLVIPVFLLVLLGGRCSFVGQPRMR